MKNRISKVLGIGLSAGLLFGLIGALFAAPVYADLMEWGIVNTPSWEGNVIVPGSDIFHYDIDGNNGNRVIAVGEINTVDISTNSITDISGSFSVHSYQASITYISSSILEVKGTLWGDTSYLFGNFTAIQSITSPAFSGVGVVTGEITGNPESGNNDDVLNFHGFIYGIFFPFPDMEEEGNTSGGSAPLICVQDADIQSWSIGSISSVGTGDYREPRVWKSEDGGVTWEDITSVVQDASNLPGPFIQFGYGGVAIAPDDEDWLVISGTIFDPNVPTPAPPFGVPATVASKDGADNFTYAGDMVDTTNSTRMGVILDVDVSPETDSGVHVVAVAGVTGPPDLSTSYGGSVFRLDAGTWLTGSWEDTSYYNGWDSGVATAPTVAVVTGEFSPNFYDDRTYVCMGVDVPGSPGIPYIQMGLWESGGAWNDDAGFPKSVKIDSDGQELLATPDLGTLGLALPADYDGNDPGARSLFLYVNGINTVTGLVGGYVFRLDNDSLSPTCGPSGDPLLASIDIYGDADTGKMMIGTSFDWDQEIGPVRFTPCEGVAVYHTEELDFCCPQWESACKNPSGPYAALVKYSPGGEKAYASTTGMVGFGISEIPKPEFWGGWSDESAFSVSLDDGVSFNQLGLIDTDIDLLSDVAVCPDCGVIYLSTINKMDLIGACAPGEWVEVEGEWQFNLTDGYGMEISQVCNCDSVWRSYDNGDTWERIFHGDWSTEGDALLLRLPCDAVEDCCDQDPVSPSGTIYLGIQGSNEMFYSRDCGQCWNETTATKIDFIDFAVGSENVVYVISGPGDFSMSTQYGRRWSEPVNTGLDSSISITYCCEAEMIVVGPWGEYDREIAWSDDNGENWNLTDPLPSIGIGGLVHVTCDPSCENIIYAAEYGIFRTDITDGAWTDLNALYREYTGIVVAREGTLYASSDDIKAKKGKPCADRFGSSGSTYSGMARNLDPCETACCGTEDWDYLICGLGGGDPLPTETFLRWPHGLKICGCLSADTNSILWAIDIDHYDVTDGAGDNDEYGGLWSYEDCAAKVGPTLTSPADGAVLDCEPCAGCDAANFTLKWERMCEACSYDIQIMDEDGNLVVEWVDIEITGDPPTLFFDGTTDDGDYYLECGMNYTWKVRMANTSCECVHSPWSETWSFTVAVGAADAIQLLAPTKGAMDVPINNIGFSWSSVRSATSYSFVLSPNANLAGALVSQDMSTTAFNYVGPLDYSKAYYWQIIAWQDGTRLTTSSIGVFNTMAEPAAPTPPVVIEEQPAPVINIPPAEQITPTWIYVIIGVGCALAVVVIVLIVRTRRP